LVDALFKLVSEIFIWVSFYEMVFFVLAN
jgi:hypothetical protein